MVAAVATIKALSVGSASGLPPAPHAKLMRVARQDVSSTIGAAHDLDALECSFAAFLVGNFKLGSPTYLVVETEDLEIGFVPLALPQGHGFAPIKKVLELMDAHHGVLPVSLGEIVGPSVQRLNARRLRKGVDIIEVAHGPPVPDPICSLVIPLFGRIFTKVLGWIRASSASSAELI